MRIDTFTYCTNKEPYYREIRGQHIFYGEIIRRERVQPACKCLQKRLQNGLFFLLACEAGEGDHSVYYRDLTLRCAERSFQRYLRRQCSLENAIDEMVEEWRLCFKEEFEPFATSSRMDRLAPSSFLALVGSERKVAALYCSDWQVACISNGAYDPFLRGKQHTRRGFSRRNDIFYCILRDPIPDAIILLTRKDVERDEILPAIDSLQKYIWKNRTLSVNEVERVMGKGLREFREQGIEVGVIGYWSDKRPERPAYGTKPTVSQPTQAPARTAPPGQQRQQPPTRPVAPSWHRERQKKELTEARQSLEQARQELSVARERRAQMEKQLGYLEQDYQRKRENRKKMKDYLDRKASYLEPEARSDPGEAGEGGTP